MDTTLLLSEFEYRRSRAGGPGGQHVNKVETKVEARWHVQNSGAISEVERSLLVAKYASKITADGFLSVTDQTTRSALSNQEKAQRKLHQLIQKGLILPKKRKKTAIPLGAKVAIRKEKERTKIIKSTRRKVNPSHFE